MLKPPEIWSYRGYVTNVVDGDTIDVDIDLGFTIKKLERIRVAKIDAWEKRGEERKEGLVAMRFVKDRLGPTHDPTGNALVYLVTEVERGKYGRYVAHVTYEWQGQWRDLATDMVEAGHAEWKNY